MSELTPAEMEAVETTRRHAREYAATEAGLTPAEQAGVDAFADGFRSAVVEMTPAEQAVAEVLLRHYDSEYDASGMTLENFAADARELAAAARPHIAAETLREAAAVIADAPQPVYATWADIAGLLRSRADRIEGGSDA